MNWFTGLCCFCFCKGNQFYANHNVSLLWEARLVVVFAFAKVINFMLITTASQWFVFCWGCFCFCKGNQFYANHNSAASLKQLLCVVFAFAKVINFMLITTLSAGSWLSEGCFCFCKGNQFYANHNRRDRINSRAHVVFAFAKVINFMLITTLLYAQISGACCFCFCKGNQFYANHNKQQSNYYVSLLFLLLQR